MTALTFLTVSGLRTGMDRRGLLRRIHICPRLRRTDHDVVHSANIPFVFSWSTSNSDTQAAVYVYIH